LNPLPQTKKRAVRRLIEGVGATVVFSIRIQRILDNPERRKKLVRICGKKTLRVVQPVLRPLEPGWRKLRKHVLQPTAAAAARLWRRIMRFHRRTPLPRLRRLYLGGFAIFFLLALLLFWLGNPAGGPPQDPKAALAKLMEDTAKLIGQQRLNKAEKNLEKLKALAPQHPTVLTFSGAIKSLRKDYAGARADYSLALEVAPSSFNAAFNLAEVDFVTKNYPAATAQFRRMLDARPQDEILLYRLFLCALLENNTDLANSCLDRLSPAGTTPAYYYANAARQFQNKNIPEARKFLSTAKTFYPGKTAFFDSSNQLLGFH